MINDSPFFADLPGIDSFIDDEVAMRSILKRVSSHNDVFDTSLLLEKLTTIVEFQHIDKSPQYFNIDENHKICVRLFGQGGFGKVFKVEITNRQITNVFALKMIELEDSEVIDAQREVLCLTKLNSPNVVRYYHSWVGISRECPNLKILYIQMEFVQGQSLNRYIETKKDIDLKERKRIFKQIVRALVEIHSCGVIHRDFTPSNILFGDNLRITVIDFGISSYHRNSSLDLRDIPPRPASLAEPSVSFIHIHQDSDRCSIEEIGTPAYASPQQLMGKRSGRKDDIYSLGIIAMELFSGFRTSMERAKAITNLRKNGIVPESIDELIPDFSLLIKRMTKNEYAHRPSSKEVFEIIENLF